MDKEFTVEVTQEDIDKGCRDDARSCPIARAAQRSIECNYLSVLGGRVIWQTESGNIYTALLPRIGRDFVRDYDLERMVPPVSFILYPKACP